MRSSRRTLGLQPEVVPEDSESDNQAVGQSNGTNEDMGDCSRVNENEEQASDLLTDIVLGNNDEDCIFRVRDCGWKTWWVDMNPYLLYSTRILFFLNSSTAFARSIPDSKWIPRLKWGHWDYKSTWTTCQLLPYFHLLSGFKRSKQL